MDKFVEYAEIFQRFFWHYYGIDLNEYYLNQKEIDDYEGFKKQEKDLFAYVQEKLRKERELI